MLVNTGGDWIGWDGLSQVWPWKVWGYNGFQLGPVRNGTVCLGPVFEREGP